MLSLAKRTESLTPSYTIGISMKVAELREQGKHVINFSVGEPDFNVPEKAKEEAITAIRENRTKYDKVPGLVPLRKAICEKLQQENHLSYEPEEIVVTNGAKQAIMNTLNALVDPGEEVLVPVPYWVSYPEMIKLCGGVPVFVYPKDHKDYKICAGDLEPYVTEKTKLLFLNNPSNPAGALYDKKELEDIAAFCLEKQIYMMSDEVYERFCFDGTYTSIGSLSREIRDMTVLVNGLSKAAAMTGLRIGYTASTKKIASAISAMQGHLTSHPATISQWAAYEALKDCKDEINAQLEVYRKRRDLAMKYLDQMDKITYIRPGGAFYVFINAGAYREAFKGAGSFSVAFCDRLLEREGVAAVPGIAFGMDDYFRISYALGTEELEEGLQKIGSFIKSL